MIVQLRQAAREIWESALQAANPASCIDNALKVSGSVLSVGGKELRIEGKLIVIGAGKAASRMAQVVEEKLGNRITGGLVVTKYAHGLPLERIRQVEAGHPLPDANGVAAVREMLELLRGLKPQDIVLCLMSGGGSALWPAPAEGITLEQKQEVTSLLLRGGATILELNAVRKHLSSVKGGQLAVWAAPARIVSLIMSDVIGDPLDFIASGPTAPDTTSFPEALSIVQKYGVSVPAAVRERLEAGARGQIPDTPKPGDPFQMSKPGSLRTTSCCGCSKAQPRIQDANPDGAQQKPKRSQAFAAVAKEMGGAAIQFRPRRVSLLPVKQP
jgi:hydroxypyruvate reductase